MGSLIAQMMEHIHSLPPSPRSQAQGQGLARGSSQTGKSKHNSRNSSNNKLLARSQSHGQGLVVGQGAAQGQGLAHGDSPARRKMMDIPPLLKVCITRLLTYPLMTPPLSYP